METTRNEGAKKSFFVPLIIVLVLIILVLLFLISPLSDLVFPTDTEPTLALAVVEKVGPDQATGLYRVVVEAQVEGKPEPQVSFNRNDGMGQVEANRTLLLLEEDENFLLKAIASNPSGTVVAELELFGGIMVGASTGTVGPGGSPAPDGSGAPDPGDGGNGDDEETPPPPGDGDNGDPGPGDGGDNGEDEPDPVNRPPVITSITKSSGTVLLNDNITITAHASDPDGDPLTYAWSANGGTIASNPAVNPISWTAPDTAGTYRVTLTVRDGRDGEAVDSIDITVRAPIGAEAPEPGVFVPPDVPLVSQRTITIELKQIGSVNSAGTIVGIAQVGDDSDNRGYQGFMTFDLSSIPSTATIVSARLVEPRVLIFGDPFGELGTLRAYVHPYVSLSAGDYRLPPLEGPIARFSSRAQLNDPTAQEFGHRGIMGIQDALTGNKKFQIRLQFNERETNNDNVSDLGSVTFRLQVVYTN